MSSVDLTRSKTDWPLATLIRRVLWTYALEPAVRWWPKPFSPLRVWALRVMGARVGQQCLVMPGVSVLMPWNLVLEDKVVIGKGTKLYNFATIHIERMTVVSQDVHLCTGSHDFRHPYMPLTHAPITIGSECWVAAEAFVCPGVSIPEGAVVGARSVVTKSLPHAWAVYAGNPCRQVGTRRMKSAPIAGDADTHSLQVDHGQTRG